MRFPVRQICFSLALYSLVAGLCAWVHGPRPDLNIDHLAYIKRTDALLAHYPPESLWRGFDVRNTYAVLLAYLHGWTGDHVLSLKLMLAGMTLAWLAGFEWWFRGLSFSGAWARTAALLSGVHINFGAPQWGISSFDDSLHRTLVMPFLFLVLGWYWRRRSAPIRLLALPVIAASCLIHLGGAYLLAVLALVEGWHVLRAKDESPAGRPLLLLASLAAAIVTLALIQYSGLALTSEAIARLVPAITTGHSGMLTPKEAWTVEWAALRWRNFPPTAATLLTMLGSAAPLIGFGWLGARSTRPQGVPADAAIFMRRFALAAVGVAFGWQASIAVLKCWVPIYPLNFEEIRAIVWIVPPLIYFGVRGLEATAAAPFRPGSWLALRGGLLLVMIQPAQWIQHLPDSMKLGLLKIAAMTGSPNDITRARLARQWLRLKTEEPRFYYDALGLVAWLRTHSTPEQRILTDRDECRLAPAKVIGAPTGFLDLNPRGPAALEWLATSRALQDALLSKSIVKLIALARATHSDFIVVPWQQSGANYRDAHYSVIAVPRWE